MAEVDVDVWQWKKNHFAVHMMYADHARMTLLYRLWAYDARAESIGHLKPCVPDSHLHI